MRKSFIEDFFEGMNEKLFFGLVILVQIVFIYQGLDFTDSGFDAVFYQRIFSDPASVQYNFMYWLTGVIGGSWLRLFPGPGLLGLRIASVICTTLTFGISYNLLKNYLQTGSLRLGLFLVVLFLGTAIRELNYNDISALFFMCASWFLFAGLTKQKYLHLFIAGMFIAANMFARLPNILGLLLVIAIWHSGYLNRLTARQTAIHTILFIGGFLALTFLLFLIMKGMHHDVIFINNLELIKRMGSNPGNSHGLYPLFNLYLIQYGEGLIVSIVAIVALWSFAAIWRRLKADIPIMKALWPMIKYLILAVLTIICIYRARTNPDFWFYLFLFYAGTSLIVGFLIIAGRQPKDMQLLTAIGCITLLILPAGSHHVLMTAGKYAVWIMVPITVDYLLNIRSLSSSVIISENNRHTYEQAINKNQMDSLRNGSIFLTLLYILSVSYYYPHSDRTNRINMRFEVPNAHVSDIYTSPERARTVSELLAASARYVKANDFVLAYDCMPMYYYLTDTRPFMHNSWPGLYDDSVFKDELKKSLQETRICPVVIMQKRSTTANNWPLNDKEVYKYRMQTLGYMQNFLKSYQYREVWENDFFKIFIPAIRHLPVSDPGL
ncbi:MAG: glycosyltransferase family 39 protein [Bacteroidota bacterium]|nr:glycosyltransferase family 39 protein [Bacteroidota bacterium]